MSIQKGIGLLAVLVVIGIGLLFSIKQSDIKHAESNPTSNVILEPTRDDIVGQWRSVVENPAHKNTLARRYMRHTFYQDGELIVENEENSSLSSNWEYDNGIYMVTRTSGTSKFIEQFKLTGHDTLERILFQSIIDGKPLANYNPEDKFVRQGSSVEAAMKILNIFESSNDVTNFIDPNNLSVGTSYTLSRKTPLMPNYGGSDFAGIIYAIPGQPIKILEQKLVKNVTWYRVEAGGREGWINSIALYGQKLD